MSGHSQFDGDLTEVDVGVAFDEAAAAEDLVGPAASRQESQQERQDMENRDAWRRRHFRTM